jgi:hypothetical protein
MDISENVLKGRTGVTKFDVAGNFLVILHEHSLKIMDSLSMEGIIDIQTTLPYVALSESNAVIYSEKEYTYISLQARRKKFSKFPAEGKFTNLRAALFKDIVAIISNDNKSLVTFDLNDDRDRFE